MTFELRVGPHWTLQASSVFVRPDAYEDVTLNGFSGEEYVIAGHRGHAQLEAEFRPGYAMAAGAILQQLADVTASSRDITLREPGSPTRTFYDTTLMSYQWSTPDGDGLASLNAIWRFRGCDFSPVGLTLRDAYTLRYPVPNQPRFHLKRRELQKLDWKKVGF